MERLYHFVGRFKLLYWVPLGAWLLIMAGFLALWTVLMISLHRRIPLEQKRDAALLQRSLKRSRVAFALNLILMLVGLAIIFLVTFVRRESSKHEVILIPLRVLFGLRAPGDFWHVTVMNIVLYVPFSCGFCFLMGQKLTHSVGATILICFIFSITAEALQYFFGSGLAEVDDVLMNTLGSFLGTIPYMLCHRIKGA